jgi:FkbM family methyltransferase
MQQRIPYYSYSIPKKQRTLTLSLIITVSLLLIYYWSSTPTGTRFSAPSTAAIRVLLPSIALTEQKKYHTEVKEKVPITFLQDKHLEYIKTKIYPPIGTKSYSQFQQDEIIYTMFFQDYDHPGTFLELGAADGVFSNTFYYSKHFNWGGVLIEPSPIQFKDLVLGSLCKQTDVLCYNYAICPQIGTIKMSGLGMRGGINPENIEYAEDKQYIAKCAPLAAILKDAQITHIDFFSLDVEGSEYSVLDSMDWENISVYVILIEVNQENKNELYEEQYAILKQLGFYYVMTIEGSTDQVWVNPKNNKGRFQYKKFQ